MTTETQTPMPDPPATPAPAADRIAEIETVRDSNITDYFEKGLDTELLELRKDEAAATDPTLEGDDEPDDGSEDEKPSDLSPEDLELLQPAAEADAAARAEFVPDEPSGYEIPQIEGYTWTDADQAAAEPFLEAFHAQGLSQAAADALLETYGQRIVEIRQQVDQSDASSAKAAKVELARTWGGQEAVSENIETIKEFLADESRIPGDVATMIAEARAPNGQRLLNTPAFVELLYQAASRQTSQPSQAPRAGYVPRPGYANERAEIMDLMTSDIDQYNYGNWKGSGVTPSARLLQIMRQTSKSSR